MEGHMNNSLKEHLSMSVKSITKLTEENSSIKPKIAQLSMENWTLKEQMEAKEKELKLARPTGWELTKYITVTNLPCSVNEGMLKSVFGQYGSVFSVTLTGSDDMATIEYCIIGRMPRGHYITVE